MTTRKRRTPTPAATVIDMRDVDEWERTCPTCGRYTNRRSIDGGLTSQFYGECGHGWDVTPLGKEAHK